MNQKHIGVIVVILGVVLASLMFFINEKEKNMLDAFVESEGTCFLEDGTCLHESNNTNVFVGSIIVVALLILGIYLIIFDKTQKRLVEQNLDISNTLKVIDKKDKFSAFLSAFREDEKLILKAVHEQEGITQATLRYRTGLSKTQLSLLLASLEEREIVSKEPSGKTNKVYIKKKF